MPTLSPPAPARAGAAPARARRAVIEVRSPATGRKIGEVPSCGADEAREMIARARLAQLEWEKLGLSARCEAMHRFADVLLRRIDEVADLIALENGKARQEALTTEIIPVLNLTRYFADHAAKILAPRDIPLHTALHRRSYLHYRPRGVVLVISPWNFPFSIPTGEVVMALIAGNTVVQKPASLTPHIALKFRELMDRADVPADVFQVCTTSGAVAEQMIEMGVSYVNFTGSTAVGRRVAEICGRHLIPCSMELGGKDPALVLADADVEQASNAIVWGAFANSGQTCASVERVYAHASVYDELVQKIVIKTRRLRQGDPSSLDTDVGAMTDPAQVELLRRQVAEARAGGAKLLTGGQGRTEQGCFFEPTVLTDVDESFEVAREESFGPVLPIMKVEDDDEAVRRANASVYGLNAYVFSRDKRHAREIAERLQAGTVMINEVLFTHAAPETPWGGVKASGIGRVHGDDGLRALCETYHVNEERLGRPKDHPIGVWYPYSRARYTNLKRLAHALFGRGIGARLKGVLGA
jgi:succinate-semialdehyde dehydrogenase/glutarate-semialdehyde dehydrogenase